MSKFLFFIVSFCLIFQPSLGFAYSGTDDTYFQDVTTQAWREYDRAQKRKIRFGEVLLEDSPELNELYEEGLSYQNQGRIKKAVKTYQRALALPPVFPATAEILWQLGHCYEKQYQWVDAFDMYGRLYKTFPAFEFSDEAVQRQYEAAKILAEGKERVVLSYPTEKLYIDIAAELFQRLQKQVPKTDIAARSQFELGNIYYQKKEFGKASREYYEVVLNFPGHFLRQESLYQSGVAAFRQVRGADYDAEMIEIVLNRLSQFVEEYPNDDRTVIAGRLQREMKELEAEKLFNTAQYYLRTGNKVAANIYFDDLLASYPKSSWSRKAREYIERD